MSSCRIRLDIYTHKPVLMFLLLFKINFSAMSLEGLFQRMAALPKKKKNLSYVKMKPLQCKWYLLPLVIPMSLFQRESLHSLCSHHLRTQILWKQSPLSILFSSQKRSNSFSLSSQGRFPDLGSSSWPFFGSSCFLLVFLGLWGPALYTLLQI